MFSLEQANTNVKHYKTESDLRYAGRSTESPKSNIAMAVFFLEDNYGLFRVLGLTYAIKSHCSYEIIFFFLWLFLVLGHFCLLCQLSACKQVLSILDCGYPMIILLSTFILIVPDFVCLDVKH